MLSNRWLRERSPGAATALQNEVSKLPGRAILTPVLMRAQFTERWPVDVIDPILRQIEAVIEAARRKLTARPRSKGGPKPIIERRMLIMALAEVWTRAGLKVSSGSKSDFTAFTDSVLQEIGWSTDGVETAVVRALKEWREKRKLTAAS
jgi:hypothetical protein